MSILHHLFYYPLLPSVFIAGMFASACAFAVVGSFTEAWGLNFTYSKFSPFSSSSSSYASGVKPSIRCVPSRTGMLLIYTPALVAAAAAAFLPGALAGERSWLLCFVLFVHFFKRVLEVLFIHQYSGHVPLNTALQISPGYLSATACLLHAQNLAVHPPTLDLQLAGILLFLAGITGNFYHHLLLAGLRTNNNNNKGDKSYKIPKGGLFGLVACPHYLFEAIEFVGFALISQTLFASGVLVGTLGYLMGRSWATRKWYLSKFKGEFPRHVKALIPYVF
ncbi:3-oxo-5-alpha-steroid 4-dehydrogenase 1-like [Zingiber officinale]|uniref:3-oxo-5-alpha-steroid 4-dehydrogenase C-terminal domain-containing protein n=1 Tax=Zingiber officinale TaxID=94328 RepID=A0A8J5GVZ6_ZINOF|nr:3-oxo-5-alpha-steroid 4-dehydrogenase 1-like [Zingiber officinale]KAG6507343.1 hypothetical protein ZIOFF_032685 [Zingiber officinale]